MKNRYQSSFGTSMMGDCCWTERSRNKKGEKTKLKGFFKYLTNACENRKSHRQTAGRVHGWIVKRVNLIWDVDMLARQPNQTVIDTYVGCVISDFDMGTYIADIFVNNDVMSFSCNTQYSIFNTQYSILSYTTVTLAWCLAELFRRVKSLFTLWSGLFTEIWQYLEKPKNGWKSLLRNDASKKPGPIALNGYQIWNQRHQNR